MLSIAANVPFSTSPSSPSTYLCLHPYCDHISSRAHDLKLHMRVHFPDLLDCKYEWCGRTGAYGFKREDHRMEHYKKEHSKESEYPLIGIGSAFGQHKAGRSLGHQSIPAASTTDLPILLTNEATRVHTKVADEKLSTKDENVPSLGSLQHSALSPEILARRGIPPEKVGAIHHDHPLPASLSESEVVRKALDANNVKSTATTSDDAGMEFSEAEESSSCSDDERMLERLEDLEAHTWCEDRYSTETISNANEQEIASLSHCSTRENLAIIKTQVLATFLTSEAYEHDTSLNFEWDVLAFMEDQFRDHECPTAVLGSVITISGSVQHAQATTCAEYIKQSWTAHGSRILDALQDALHSSTHTSHLKIGACTDDGTLSSLANVKFDISHEKVSLNIKSGTRNLIVDVVQQLAWMGAALRTSADGQVQYCEPKLEQVTKAKRGEPAAFNITFEVGSFGEEDQSCWLPLFVNPVIARGFPIPERENGERGLEVPLEIMAALGGARHVTEFGGGLVLKGHSAMFVPVKRHHQSVQWHLIRRSDEQRVLYRDVSIECPNRAMLDELNHKSLENTRAFLGWWRSAETHLGTADAAYHSIDWSPAGQARRSAKISSATLGFQNLLTGQLSFTMGAKDGRLHFSQKGPFQRIVQCAEKTPVVLFDQADRRAWFVSGVDLMLHVVQTRHYLSPYQIDGKFVELTPAIPKNGRAAATEAITANQRRQLYERNVESEKTYYFQDAILDIWSQMERLMEKEDSMEACGGLALHGTMQDKLHGWEYMSLVHEKNYQRKEATIQKSSGGWVDLINDVDCLVIFATGLGEIIRPVSDLSRLCRPWRTLPKGKDFLAAGVPIMELLYSEAGSRLTHTHLSTSHLQWHRGSTLFERCSDMTSNRCKCDRTQQIYQDSLFKTFGHVRPPGDLEENGCVVFGQAHHSWKPHKNIARRQNAVPILLNTPIQNAGTIMHNHTEDDRLLSPTPAASVSLEPNEVKGYTDRNLRRPPSPPISTDRPMDDKTHALRRKRRLSHLQISELDTCKGHDICTNETPLSEGEDNATCPTEYQSLPKHDRKFIRQAIAPTQTVCASKDEYEPAHVRKGVRPEAKIEHYGHPFGCSCMGCLTVDFEPPCSIGVLGNVIGSRRNPKSMTERRERQPV